VDHAKNAFILLPNRERDDLAAVLEELSKKIPDFSFGTRWLSHFQKSEETFLPVYTLETAATPNNQRYEEHVDAPYSFHLLYYDQRVATVGFEATHKAALITQIQNTIHSAQTLQRLDWKMALALHVREWARINGIEFYGIQSAQNNMWYRNSKSNASHGNRGLISVLETNYDALARKLKLHSAEDGNYYGPTNDSEYPLPFRAILKDN